MTRLFILFTVVSLLALPLHAQEPPSPSDRPEADAAAPESAESAKGNVEFQLQDADCDTCKPDFYPIYDCGCSLQSLDDWCNCDTSCCVTDEWCEHDCFRPLGTQHLTDEPGKWMVNDDYCDVQGTRMTTNTTALRMGVWAVGSKGSQVKTGEYQSLQSSPFYDLDTMLSDGDRTLDMNITGLDNEANNVGARYYGPGLTARFKYQRFFRQLDHDPLYGFDLATGAPGPTDNIVTRDLNAGADYAMRVQMLDARFQGKLTENIKWRLNLWGMRKFGERQVNAVAHCFDLNPAAGTQNTRCHLQSQQQNIDWLTMQIEPVIEAKYEYVSVEYARTMRSFGQNDQLTTRDYTNFGYTPASGTPGPPFLYAFVPENFTQIDRLKFGIDLTENNKLYAYNYYGNTRNQFRDTTRQFSGVDVRLINQSIEGATITAYGTFDEQNNSIASTYFRSAPLGANSTNPSQGEPGGLDHPFNYLQTRFGVRSNWKPFSEPFTTDENADIWTRTMIVSGYEYSMLERNFATYSSTRLGTFTQPDTKGHRIEFGPQTQLSQSVNTFVRYKGWFNEDPLIGVRESTGRFNTNQPEQVHRIDIGGTWNPADNLIMTAQFGLVNSWNNSTYTGNPSPTAGVQVVPIHFDETSYPITLTTFYAPTDRLSLNAGYGYYSNWIEQDIAIGFRTTKIETLGFDYAGQNHMVSLGANYAWTDTVSLVGGYEWNRGTNAFSNPTSTTGGDWNLGPGLASYSDVLVETQRFIAGADWSPYRQTNLFVRYNYFDYDDISENLTSGTAHMLLTGVTYVR